MHQLKIISTADIHSLRLARFTDDLNSSRTPFISQAILNKIRFSHVMVCFHFSDAKTNAQAVVV